ncbi:hypothetical protein Q9L58_009970 [Maublancomyces gigas]|uniref:Uncharacterized protein n=1 Tax=Discina gigas TaxID=1032678 RepID=A0ABR3G5H6_9PEZI
MSAITSSRKDTSDLIWPPCRSIAPSPDPAGSDYHNRNLTAEELLEQRVNNLSPDEYRLHRQQQGISRVVGFLRDASHNGPQSTPVPERVGFQPRLFTSLRKHVESFGLDDRQTQYYGAEAPTYPVIPKLSFAHEVMAKLPSRIMQLLDANFYGPEWRGNPVYSIRSCGSSPIQLISSTGFVSQRQPNGSLRLGISDLPFLICEAAATQPLSTLQNYVQEYISGTSGAIRIIIFANLEAESPSSRNHRPAMGHGHPEDDNDTIGYTRGTFSVFQFTTEPNATNPDFPIGNILCMEYQQEFYPTPHPGAVVLTWASILNVVPHHLLGRELRIPYAMLHELFLVAAAGSPPDRGWRPSVHADDPSAPVFDFSCLDKYKNDALRGDGRGAYDHLFEVGVGHRNDAVKKTAMGSRNDGFNQGGIGYNFDGFNVAAMGYAGDRFNQAAMGYRYDGSNQTGMGYRNDGFNQGGIGYNVDGFNMATMRYTDDGSNQSMGVNRDKGKGKRCRDDGGNGVEGEGSGGNAPNQAAKGYGGGGNEKRHRNDDPLAVGWYGGDGLYQAASGSGDKGKGKMVMR